MGATKLSFAATELYFAATKLSLGATKLSFVATKLSFVATKLSFLATKLSFAATKLFTLENTSCSNQLGRIKMADDQFDFPDEDDNDFEELIRYYFYKGFTYKGIR